MNLNLSAAAPEIVLLCALFGVLLADLWTSDENRYITHYLSIGSMLAASFTQIAVWTEQPAQAFNGFYLVDGVSQLAKLTVYLGTAALFAYAKPYNKAQKMFKGEYYTLAMFAATGMSVMISSAHFLTAYIGLELLSLSLYAMIALRRDSGRSAEAALKYFVLGALASGLLLYGISMVYGATHSLDFATVLASSYSEIANEWLLKLGLVFIVVAIAFKLGAVPFHMWVPDVYHGAPTSVAAFVGTAPKIAAVMFAFRILLTGFGEVHQYWAPMFAVLAVASLVVGNLAAIMQTNIKRMLAYSTVSHMGFILLAFMAGSIGSTAGLYYAITYALMAAAGFGILMVLSNDNIECEEIKDLAGLNQRHAWFALLMLLVMFSMAGIPPLMGFYAKFGVIMVLLKFHYVWLSVFAVVMSLIGAFYYLRVVKVMYFDEPTHDQPIGSNYAAKFFLSVNAFLLVLWGVMPQTMIDWCAKALENTL